MDNNHYPNAVPMRGRKELVEQAEQARVQVINARRDHGLSYKDLLQCHDATRLMQAVRYNADTLHEVRVLRQYPVVTLPVIRHPRRIIQERWELNDGRFKGALVLLNEDRIDVERGDSIDYVPDWSRLRINDAGRKLDVRIGELHGQPVKPQCRFDAHRSFQELHLPANESLEYEMLPLRDLPDAHVFLKGSDYAVLPSRIEGWVRVMLRTRQKYPVLYHDNEIGHELVRRSLEVARGPFQAREAKSTGSYIVSTRFIMQDWGRAR